MPRKPKKSRRLSRAQLDRHIISHLESFEGAVPVSVKDMHFELTTGEGDEPGDVPAIPVTVPQLRARLLFLQSRPYPRVARVGPDHWAALSGFWPDREAE